MKLYNWEAKSIRLAENGQFVGGNSLRSYKLSHLPRPPSLPLYFFLIFIVCVGVGWGTPFLVPTVVMCYPPLAISYPRGHPSHPLLSAS